MLTTLPGSGSFALPIALAGAAAALVVATAQPARPDAGVVSHESPLLQAGRGEGSAASQDRVEMEVVGVVPLDGQTSSMLVLQDKRAETVLPLVIGQSEALAIELRLRGVAAPRPLTHDLLDRTIAALGGRVVEIEIAALRNSVFEAKIRLAQGEQSLVIDARPSDSVALALQSRAPIFARRKVLDDAGLSRASLDRLRRGSGGAHAAPSTTL